MNDSNDRCPERLAIAALRRDARVLRLLAHPQRLRIVGLLERGGAAPVHALTARLRLPQAAVSGHLARLRRAGVLAAERRGREVRYRIGDARAVRILRCLCDGGKDGKS